eukprot:1781709-Prymnesium_polylepis.1
MPSRRGVGLLACCACAARAAPHQAEEEALVRMLTLHQRSLVSDRPMPLSDLPPLRPSASKRRGGGSCAASNDGRAAPDWRAAPISPWEAQFAEGESLGLAP